MHTICNASYTSGNGLFWLGKSYDVQMPRAVHLGSQVCVAAASGIAAAILAGLPTGLLPLLLSCELDSLNFLELSMSGLQSGFLEVLLSYSPYLPRVFCFSCCFTSHLFTCLLIAFIVAAVWKKDMSGIMLIDATFILFQQKIVRFMSVFRWCPLVGVCP